MAEMEIKTNGHEISEKLQKVVDTWKSFLEEKLDVKKFSLFYYGDKLIFADCILNDNHYGRFNITEKQVHFNGHTCTAEQRDAFQSATWHDDCFNGKLFK